MSSAFPREFFIFFCGTNCETCMYIYYVHWCCGIALYKVLPVVAFVVLVCLCLFLFYNIKQFSLYKQALHPTCELSFNALRSLSCCVWLFLVSMITVKEEFWKIVVTWYSFAHAHHHHHHHHRHSPLHYCWVHTVCSS